MAPCGADLRCCLSSSAAESTLPLSCLLTSTSSRTFGLGSGNGICLPASVISISRGSSITNRAGWRMRLAIRPASSPAPQYRSARAGPTIADPVSCAIIRRPKGETGFTRSIGRLASMKNGVPYSCSLSTAMDRPGVNGTPCAPTGLRSFDSPVMRKKTYERLAARAFAASSGCAAIQSRTRCADISWRAMRLRSISTRSIERVLIERNLIARQEMSAQRVRDWMAAHPDEAAKARAANRSYVFFRITGLSNERKPVGAQGVPLTPGRSIAVDRLHEYGTPFFIEANLPIERVKPVSPFGRLMIAQDTGSAIVGPARADLYWGAGDDAGRIANRIRHPARFVMLLPREIDMTEAGRHMPLPLPKPKVLELVEVSKHDKGKVDSAADEDRQHRKSAPPVAIMSKRLPTTGQGPAGGKQLQQHQQQQDQKQELTHQPQPGVQSRGPRQQQPGSQGRGPPQRQQRQATASREPQPRQQQAAIERHGPQQKQQPPTTEGRGPQQKQQPTTTQRRGPQQKQQPKATDSPPTKQKQAPAIHGAPG